ncbi:MAG: putative metal-dependent phosphohydrolase [Solirubrobacterales bacterium]|nr:putative metal-dependent phosphohydrolase [Solirubrobacterales bacterium]
MVPPHRSYEESAATLARALAHDDPAALGTPGDASPAADEPAVLHTAPRNGRMVWPYVAVLLAALATVAGFSSTAAATSRPGLLVMLVVCVVGLDLIRIDVFERINLSPASVPALALAFLFGPLGPIAAELAIAVVRIVRRVPPVKWAFDVGALGLAGAAAAAVWAAAAPGPVGGELAVGVAAALAAYGVTSLLLPVVMWLARGDRPLAAWREQLAWLWPHYVGFGLLAGFLVECERRLGPAGVLVFAVPVLLLWVGEQQYLSRSRAAVNALRERNAELERANVRYVQAIISMGHALQARDPDAAGRTERVSQLARIIGAQMGLPEAQQNALSVGVVVHDIGRVLLRPREDPRVIPQLSCRILDPLDLPPVVKEMARHHLERFDGLGSPDGLRGETIPLPARIVAVADALDDLTTFTSAHPALPLQGALAELRQDAGTRFCPRVVAALEQSLAVDPTLRRYFGERQGDGLPTAA